MTPSADDLVKATLQRYLQRAREAMLWKLEGLSDADLRRAVVPSGTNLLGLVKHLAIVEFAYLGTAVGRPDDPIPEWDDDAEPDIDLRVTADESTADVIDRYRRAATHADQTIALLPLSAVGHVSWWSPDRSHPTLHALLVHVIAETNRHAGHADIAREWIDGSVGMYPT